MQDEVIGDRRFFNDNAKRFLRLLNLSLKEFARDLNTIDPDFYHEEETVTLTPGVEHMVGKSLGLSHVVTSTTNYYIPKGKRIPRIKRGNKSTAWGIEDYYKNGNLYVKLVDNSDAGTLGDMDVTIVYAREPNVVVDSVDPLYKIDAPEQAMVPLGLLIRHYYFMGRQFIDEAMLDKNEYRQYMNTYLKKKQPFVVGSELGRSYLSGMNYSPFR